MNKSKRLIDMTKAELKEQLHVLTFLITCSWKRRELKPSILKKLDQGIKPATMAKQWVVEYLTAERAIAR
jgi:hypothetical protein